MNRLCELSPILLLAFSIVAIAERASAQKKGFTNSLGMKMVHVPSRKPHSCDAALRSKKRESSELPARSLPYSFYIARTETTVAQFRAFVKGAAYNTYNEDDKNWGWKRHPTDAVWSYHMKPRHNWRKPSFHQTGEHPVVYVSWNDADKFCKWLSKKEGRTYRLPTAAEWQLACSWGERREEQTKPSSRKVLAEYANLADMSLHRRRPTIVPRETVGNIDDGYGFTAPVGSFRANALGLVDMHGNVAEWCQDKVADKSITSDEWRSRVLKGTSYFGDWHQCTCSFQSSFLQRLSLEHIGFRVVVVPRSN